MSLYYTLVLFIMILCYGLVFLRFSVMILCYGMGLYRGLALFSIMGGLSSSLFLEYILLTVAAVAVNSTPFPCFGCTVKPFQSY